MNDWTELSIKVSANDIDLAGEIAHMVVPYGIYIEDYRDMEQEVRSITHMQLIDETLLSRDRDIGIVHIYLPPHEHPAEAIAFLRERYTAAGIAHEISDKLCKNEDWENNWKAYFHPLKVGGRLLIQPVWEEPADPEGRAVLLLEPGLAFGSGSHATTRLCMELLEQYTVSDCRVLDVGCGSGILAIAAVKLGAGSALGVDIDPLAVTNARENAERNGLTEQQAAFVLGDLAACVQGCYEVVVSNIVADAILSLKSQVGQHMAQGGVWICSGIIDTRADEVIDACKEAGFQLACRKDEDGWVCLAFTR